MKIAQVLAELQKRLQATVPGRKTYIVTGSRDKLHAFRKKLLELVEVAGYPAIKCLSLNNDFINYLEKRRLLEPLIGDERALRRKSARNKLQKHLREFITSALKEHVLLCLHDFELVLGYGLELEFLCEWAVGNRQVVFLVPGEQHHGDVIAYAWDHEHRRTFPRNLVRPEWTWVLGEDKQD